MPEPGWTPKDVADALEDAARPRRTYGRHEVEVRLGPPAAHAIDRADEMLAWLRACAGRESPGRFKINRAIAKYSPRKRYSWNK